jgi:hypothetical protein
MDMPYATSAQMEAYLLSVTINGPIVSGALDPACNARDTSAIRFLYTRMSRAGRYSIIACLVALCNR